MELFLHSCTNKLVKITAKYQNEAELGEAIAEAIEKKLVKREELFITTKVSFCKEKEHFLVEILLN